MDNADFLLNNPIFGGMDPIKLQFIKAFMQKDKPTSSNEIMPFLLQNMTIAKKQNIQFNQDEVQLIARILTRDMPENEKQKVQRIMSLLMNSNPSV